MPPSAVIKRHGDSQVFSRERILRAVAKAGVVDPDAIVDDAIAELPGTPTVENVQDTIERALMRHGQYAAAKRYILYREKRAEARTSWSTALKRIEAEPIRPPFGPIGWLVYKRTYARKTTDTTEEFGETIKRVLKACQEQFHCGFSADEILDAWRLFMNLKGSVSGRTLWQAGTQTVDRLGLASLMNCAFTKVDHPVTPFVWTMDMLALGCGVGFSIQRENIDKLPPIVDADVRVTRMDTKDADFIVPDSREGWAKLLAAVLQAYFTTGESFTYSTILLRGKGSPIAGFGGVASGPEVLCSGMSQIADVLRRRRGQKITSVDALDIMNIIGSIIVAGNVRRSAMIAIGDADDIPYLMAKRWDLGTIPSWRCMSNNTVVCTDVSKLPDEFWQGYHGNGEPYGLVNIDLARRVGRLVDGDKYPDPSVDGGNPCMEQLLSDKETCCLAEIFLPNVSSYDEARRLSEILYRICKHMLAMPCHWKSTSDIIAKNFRMGIGISGWAMATDEQLSWLPELYKHLRAYDVEYSAKKGWPTSVKLTTVKPSGTLSLLSGITPGAHPAIYPYFIRRVRMASDSPLLERCQRAGYKVEPQVNFDGSLDPNTTVVEFPCSFPPTAKLAKDMTAIDQLETIKWLQTYWTDNACSVTVYYRSPELPDIKRWLAENFSTSVKSVSFLLHNDHGFKQAPYEEISRDAYEAMVSSVLPLQDVERSAVGDREETVLLDADCDGAACPVR